MKSNVNMSGMAALLLLLAVTAMSSMGGAMAQASCLSVAGASAPVADANAAIQSLRSNPGQCCQSSSGFFTLLTSSGNAALTIGSSTGWCLSCVDAGNYLNIVLSQCIDGNNQVQGAYGVEGSSKILYLTSFSNRPVG